jgi:hypothetical protein
MVFPLHFYDYRFEVVRMTLLSVKFHKILLAIACVFVWSFTPVSASHAAEDGGHTGGGHSGSGGPGSGGPGGGGHDSDHDHGDDHDSSGKKGPRFRGGQDKPQGGGSHSLEEQVFEGGKPGGHTDDSHDHTGDDTSHGDGGVKQGGPPRWKDLGIDSGSLGRLNAAKAPLKVIHDAFYVESEVESPLFKFQAYKIIVQQGADVFRTEVAGLTLTPENQDKLAALFPTLATADQMTLAAQALAGAMSGPITVEVLEDFEALLGVTSSLDKAQLVEMANALQSQQSHDH